MFREIQLSNDSSCDCIVKQYHPKIRDRELKIFHIINICFFSVASLYTRSFKGLYAYLRNIYRS